MIVLSKDEGWELLDKPNNIYAREISFSSFEFAKADEEIIRVIDLTDYTTRQIKDVVSKYYGLTFEHMFIIHKDDVLILIAECLFKEELK